jgi:predicted transposase YdaD
MEDVQVVQQWDDTTKRLIQSNPQHFVSWILHGGVFKTYLATELKNWTLTADMMMHVLVHDQNMLLHLEIQSKEDNTMPQRLLEYNILATREHKQPVLSCVIYLRKDRRVAQSPLRWYLPSGQETLAFHFQVIRLWEIPSTEIIETGLSGLLPLLPLTREAGNERPSI